MLEMGIIRPSTSPWAAPVVLNYEVVQKSLCILCKIITKSSIALVFIRIIIPF